MNKLLKNIEVTYWLSNNLTFITNQSTKKSEYKKIEDIWGRSVMKTIRPDLKLDKQWTNLFGEYIVREYFENKDIDIKNALNINGYKPDFEIENYIIEVKTGSYFTDGTGHEKILGTPFKYCEIPILYNKPLLIICIGKAELLGKDKYGFLDGTILENSVEKQSFINFFKEKNITYIGFSNLDKLFNN